MFLYFYFYLYVSGSADTYVLDVMRNWELVLEINALCTYVHMYLCNILCLNIFAQSCLFLLVKEQGVLRICANVDLEYYMYICNPTCFCLTKNKGYCGIFANVDFEAKYLCMFVYLSVYICTQCERTAKRKKYTAGILLNVCIYVCMDIT